MIKSPFTKCCLNIKVTVFKFYQKYSWLLPLLCLIDCLILPIISFVSIAASSINAIRPFFEKISVFITAPVSFIMAIHQAFTGGGWRRCALGIFGSSLVFVTHMPKLLTSSNSYNNFHSGDATHSSFHVFDHNHHNEPYHHILSILGLIFIFAANFRFKECCNHNKDIKDNCCHTKNVVTCI